MGQISYKRIRNYLGFKNNENTCHIKIWDTVNSILRGNVIALKIYVRKVESLKINDLSVRLKKLK